jgi:thiamine-monophosphate kinase
MGEFELIRTYLADVGAKRADVGLDVGDDCALLRVPPGLELAVSIDTLVAGVHFFPDCDPAALGHKSLAVGLSDLAAMGAVPAWATLALTLPEVDGDWLAGFVRGLDGLARRYGVRLVGGDTTRGPLTISVQVHGLVPAGEALRRDRARPGDLICVSGSLGAAGLALRQMLRGQLPEAALRARLERPIPRIALGRALRGLASAAIDLSDGLASDLGQILAASGVGATVELGRLPLAPQVAEAVSAANGDWALPLGAGDDFELCFTLPPEQGSILPVLVEQAGCPLARIGVIEPGRTRRWQLPDGTAWEGGRLGFDHFTSEPKI